MAGPIRIAILGNGFARTTVLPCLRNVEGISVVGIASPNLERARATAEQFGIACVAADYRELLRDAAPDLVFVVTPPHRHLEMTLDALGVGCHVVCEKPTAMSAGESLRMLEAARAHPDRLTLIDHELRFDPKRRRVMELIAEGELGEIEHAEFFLSSPGRRDPTTPWTWWSDRHQGGGAWGAIGSHAIDSLRSFVGEISSARGRLETCVKERLDPASGQPRLVTSDDYAAAWLRFASGARGTVHISLVAAERRHEITLTGTRGALRLTEEEPLLYADGSHGGWRPISVPDELPPNAALGIPDTDWARNFLRLSRAIVDTLQGGSSVLPGAANFEDGHRNQAVLDAVYRSSEDARWSEVIGMG